MAKLYMNKNGFKCVEEQLVKTDGFDPQEYHKNGGDVTKMKKVKGWE